MSHQFAWETRHGSYERRVKMLCEQMKFTWFSDERQRLLERLCFIVGDPVAGHELRTIVAAYNRELIGRRSAARSAELHAPL